MRPLLPCPAALLLVLASGPAARAHYHMLIPDRHSVKAGDKVTFIYQFGHPFEHQLFDAEAPARATVFAPDGKTTDVLGSLEKVTVPGEGDKRVSAYRFTFTPPGRGDYVFLFDSPPVWMEEEKRFVQDRTKVVLHVEAQRGWWREAVPNDGRPKALAHQETEIVPLTRPYGILRGSVFRVEVTGLREWMRRVENGVAIDVELPLHRCLVEAERYNPAPPKNTPVDELITFTARTDAAGTAAFTLGGLQPAWWCITANKDAGLERERDGKKYPVRQRATFWVHVGPDRPSKPAE